MIQSSPLSFQAKLQKGDFFERSISSTTLKECLPKISVIMKQYWSYGRASFIKYLDPLEQCRYVY